VSPAALLARRALLAWLAFWFPTPAPRAQLALVRVGTALVLLYVLFVRSFDLEAQFSPTFLRDAALRESLDPLGWPFSVFLWVSGSGWLWSMHVLAMLLAAAFLAGVLTPLMAALSLVFQLSYAHHNPVMLLGVDGLLILALVYLSLVPSGEVLGVLGRGVPEPEPEEGAPPPAPAGEELPRSLLAGLPWSALPVRVLQLHLCVLYFQSGLGKLTTDWLSGTPLWHPRLTALGALYPLETLHAAPYLTSLITHGLLLFELFYPVLLWVRPLRYPLLALALGVHLTVGLVWGLLPFNLLMLALNLVFVPPAHLEALARFMRPLFVLPWMSNGGRD
jgi:hypothetical protein